MPTSPTEHATRVLNQAGDVLSDAVDYLRLDPVPPVWHELRRYSRKKFRADLLAGATVALVDAAPPGALPDVFDQRNLSFGEATVNALRALGVARHLRTAPAPICTSPRDR